MYLKCVFLNIIFYYIIGTSFYFLFKCFNMQFYYPYKTSIPIKHSYKNNLNFYSFSTNLSKSQHNMERNRLLNKTINFKKIRPENQRVNFVLELKILKQATFSPSRFNNKIIAVQKKFTTNTSLDLIKLDFNSRIKITNLSKHLNTIKTDIENRCIQHSTIISMAKTNNPPLYVYANVSVLMAPSIYKLDGKSIFMLVGILSSPNSFDMRNAIRDTWGSSSILSSLKRFF